MFCPINLHVDEVNCISHDVCYFLVIHPNDCYSILSKTEAEIRERDWCNVVTCHMDTPEAYVWRLQNFVLGEHILKPCPENPTPIKVKV